jgi:hypothetical protein
VNDHWHYASEIHGGAEEHHRHYDEERELASVRRDLDHVIADLRAALDRIGALEEQTPEARQAEYEADVAMADSEPWRDTLADYHVASGGADYDDFVQDRRADLDPNRDESEDA